MEYESSIKEIIANSLEQVRAIVDADTVVGRQIVTPSGTVIIPISKVSMGFASGGLDVPRDKKSGKSFGGGGGTGVTVNPIGFLTIYPDGHVEMLNMNQEKPGPIEQIAEILESTPEIINRVKGLFTSKDSEDDDEDFAETEEEYARRLADDILAAEEAGLSKKELKKLRKQQKKDTVKF